jgi:hypothetical protein
MNSRLTGSIQCMVALFIALYSDRTCDNLDQVVELSGREVETEAYTVP